jgi:hypothetical protein
MAGAVGYVARQEGVLKEETYCVLSSVISNVMRRVLGGHHIYTDYIYSILSITMVGSNGAVLSWLCAFWYIFGCSCSIGDFLWGRYQVQIHVIQLAMQWSHLMIIIQHSKQPVSAPKRPPKLDTKDRIIQELRNSSYEGV